ncbi:MAG: RNB domain-containing ribonuclease [Desulfovibrio sp.]|jgi:exoribonuclease-2|nr:RNB domain-containing ribonuclease [Desulfovibrio sp.]
MDGNAPQIALVTGESGGQLRLLLPNRRETRLPSSRVLPWIGPLYDAALSKEHALRLLEERRRSREDIAAGIQPLEVWEIAHDEVPLAPARWFAELFFDSPDEDIVAAYGRALLACKSHFRFHPPDFLVHSPELAQKRLAEREARQAREALVSGGAAFLRLLWDVACKKRALPARADREGLWPSPEVAERLRDVLFARMRDPERQDNDGLWAMLSKGLPDEAHVPLQLLAAWEQVPEHYNFWLDRADYAPGDDWWRPFADETQAVAEAARDCALPLCDLPFVSIDSASTRDVDDAFYVEHEQDGFRLTLALAAPALYWPFAGETDSRLNRAVLHRGTSLYLPEGTCHMLPEMLGTDVFSLVAGQERPALCVRMRLDAAGGLTGSELFLARVRLAANLNYADCQAALDAGETSSPSDNPATACLQALRLGVELARLRQLARIAAGAVIMNRPEPVLRLSGEGADTVVSLEPEVPAHDAQQLVAEMMILASGVAADWAAERGVPLIHRTQDVTLPKEYAGLWTRPEDMARIIRSLTPSCLEVRARRHAGLGVARYAPVTSPLRRYTDLVNEAQIVFYLNNNRPLWDETALAGLLGLLTPVLEATGQAQRFRPRYWKLLYFRQQGDKVWWPGVITEENDVFVSVSLPEQGVFARGRRQLFDERACPGLPVSVRLGKINPLYNEMQILEARS